MLPRRSACNVHGPRGPIPFLPKQKTLGLNPSRSRSISSRYRSAVLAVGCHYRRPLRHMLPHSHGTLSKCAVGKRNRFGLPVHRATRACAQYCCLPASERLTATHRLRRYPDCARAWVPHVAFLRCFLQLAPPLNQPELRRSKNYARPCTAPVS